jgi:hypothetical protein
MTLVSALIGSLAGCAGQRARWESILDAREPDGGRMAVAYQRHTGGPTIGLDFRVMVYPDSTAARAARNGAKAWESFDVPAIALRWGGGDSLIVTVVASERTSRDRRSIRRHPLPHCRVFTRELKVANPMPH